MDTFFAISDPTRRAILDRIAAGGRISAGDISKSFDCSAPAISQHLKVLRDAGLVTMEKQAQQRMYAINPAGLDEIEAWAQRMRREWSQRFSALDNLFQAQDERAREQQRNNKPKTKGDTQ